MADFNSKYSGEQVEALLDQVASGNAGGGSSVEWVNIGDTSAEIYLSANKTYYKHITSSTSFKDIDIYSSQLEVGDTAYVILYYDGATGSLSTINTAWANEDTPIIGSGCMYELSFKKTPSHTLACYAEYAVGMSSSTDPA